MSAELSSRFRMPKPRALIAEDEPILRTELRQALAALWPELAICAEASNGVEAVRALDAHAPDILFLDIEMPGMSGIEVARVANGRCHIVFVTAYDRYAVAAFEQQAIDYVMKPYAMSRLADAVSRLKRRIGAPPPGVDAVLDALAQPAADARGHLRRITAAQGARVHFVSVERICYFHADSKYTLVMTADAELVIRRPIKELVTELDPALFWQIHRSTIVNVHEIADVSRDLHGHYKLRLRQRKESLAVSETYNHLFRHM